MLLLSFKILYFNRISSWGLWCLPKLYLSRIVFFLKEIILKWNQVYIDWTRQKKKNTSEKSI